MIMALLINAIEFATLVSIIDEADAAKARVNFLLSFSWSSQWPEMVLCVSIASMAPIVPSFSNPMNVHSHNINLGENYPKGREKSSEIFQLVHKSHLAPFESFISHLAQKIRSLF